MTNEPLKATQPLPYECFQDRSYYDMWCVRRVNEREWGKGFHLVNGEEAAALRDMLNTRAVNSHHDLIEALRGVMDILGRAESNASGNPEWDYVGPRVAKARAILTKEADR